VQPLDRLGHLRPATAVRLRLQPLHRRLVHHALVLAVDIHAHQQLAVGPYWPPTLIAVPVCASSEGLLSRIGSSARRGLSPPGGLTGPRRTPAAAPPAEETAEDAQCRLADLTRLLLVAIAELLARADGDGFDGLEVAPAAPCPSARRADRIALADRRILAPVLRLGRRAGGAFAFLHLALQAFGLPVERVDLLVQYIQRRSLLNLGVIVWLMLSFKPTPEYRLRLLRQPVALGLLRLAFPLDLAQPAAHVVADGTARHVGARPVRNGHRRTALAGGCA
jgi:hypothetical protein